jgi:hypothetical protein
MEHRQYETAPPRNASLAGQRLVRAIRRWLDRLVGRPPTPVVDVALLDPHERRHIARVVRDAAQRRATSLGVELPRCLSVLVDYTISDEESSTACLETLGEPDQPAWYVVRLALTHRGVPRPLDAVIADLNLLLLAVLTSDRGWRRETLLLAEPHPVTSFALRRPRPTWKGASLDGDCDGEDGDDDVVEPRRHHNRSRKRR